jgi:hypothetical protein
MAQHIRHQPTDRPSVSLRRFPYPYTAALAICNDIDETASTAEFLEIQRFLNTKDITSMGQGIGLEIGNSFYFYDNDREFSFFTHDERAREVIIDCIHAGYLDSLHSYGDAAMTRDEALRGLDALTQADCHLDVWINHYGSRSNVSAKFGYLFGGCYGDDPASDVYHTDVTADYGIRYVWVGAGTRIVGQATAATTPLSSLMSVYDSQYPVATGKNLLKEMRKMVLGRRGDERYVLFSGNALTRPIQLADGRRWVEFIRYCNHPWGVLRGTTSRGLAYMISPKILARLKSVQGTMIVYTHLGKNSDCSQVIAPETQTALRNLEREVRSGHIYVTTTSRLLNYHYAREHLIWTHEQEGALTRITLQRLEDPVLGMSVPPVSQLQGLTFTVPDSRRTRVFLGSRELDVLARNPPDEQGMESVTIPQAALEFPYAGRQPLRIGDL